jgi:N-acetylglucosaminyldiphosphoundecaprenol N-acetyl-beta-D-mannosaminyltransferase
MPDPLSDIPRGNVLGVAVSAIDMTMALDCIERWIRSRDPHYVCVTPAHAVMECIDHPELKAVYNHSGLTTPDGMAIVWLMRWQGYRQVERVYGPDLLLAVCAAAEEAGYRNYFYGGAPEVTPRLVEALTRRFPRLQIAGYESPPFGALSREEEAAAEERIRQAKPDIVWVGLGSPRQEVWMSQEVARVNVPVLVGVGAAFDFLSDAKPQAPRWVQRSGLEWLFRFFSEPGRLWKRYIKYPRFVVLALMQHFGVRDFPV